MTVISPADPAATGRVALEGSLEGYRGELTGYCYRMLGSAFETDDAVQDTMVRAWRGLDGFDGRASLRSWLYRIATNVCIDALNGRKRRALPMDFGAPSAPVLESLDQWRTDGSWVDPMPDDRIRVGAQPSGDPAEVAVARETIRLAFVAALQRLPPRQRAVLILREVLCWRASEVADLLGGTVASVNSALQRARATLATSDHAEVDRCDLAGADQEALLGRYVAAFEAYDMAGLVELLHEDAVQTMPPFGLWLRGRADIAAWMTGPGAECRGSRLLPFDANGSPGFAQYRPSGPDGEHRAWSLQVLTVQDGRISRMVLFLDPALFTLFGLPTRLP